MSQNVIANMAIDLTKNILILSATKYTQLIDKLVADLDGAKKVGPKHAVDTPPSNAAPSNKPRVKRAPVFVDADDDLDIEVEVQEPKGEYVYDPVAHKVVFVPSE